MGDFDFSPPASQVLTWSWFHEFAGFYFHFRIHSLPSELPSPRRCRREVHLPWRHHSTDFSDGEEHMTQAATLQFPEVLARERYLGECSPSPSVLRPLVGASRCIARSEARDRLSASLWVTSLQRSGVFEIVPTENISRSGMQMVTQGFWRPDELVLVSSPPGFCVQGSVVYCKKLPSDDHFVGISLDAPVEDWTETLGFGES